jgi:hypothetical protein
MVDPDALQWHPRPTFLGGTKYWDDPKGVADDIAEQVPQSDLVDSSNQPQIASSDQIRSTFTRRRRGRHIQRFLGWRK